MKRRIVDLLLSECSDEEMKKQLAEASPSDFSWSPSDSTSSNELSAAGVISVISEDGGMDWGRRPPSYYTRNPHWPPVLKPPLCVTMSEDGFLAFVTKNTPLPQEEANRLAELLYNED